MKETNFPSHVKDWKKFEINNKIIAINALFSSNKRKEIRQAHKSKHDFRHEHMVILLMITDGKKWLF